ncbi:23S rRNA pseudouridine2605 synthase [Dethiosulfatibacter aminovorans DSM 17477]|uniref:Pseudouridine synthase n=2 Tax=Dethiosulfatibacter TaxID=448125 RepID=A0A1M6DAR5_9FIRM|nr:23S rRNA pseudouridine2605 synthase [Dethiosulfatibacter aminovorans DSM 17477]
MNKMRLNKFISNSGYTSRRKADELIFEGKVKINGETVKEPGTQVQVSVDIVEVEGKNISLEEEMKYIILNKPIKYITSVKDQFDRPSVLDLVDIKERIYPVGRLDYDSSGLIILTNDGDLTYKLTHPKHNIYKTYIVKINGLIDDETIEKLKKGVYIDNYRTRPCKVSLVSDDDRKSVLKVSILEGRNRQIRKMFEKFNFRVVYLRRISIGEISLGELPSGQWRHLRDDEVKYLKEME